MLNGFFCFRFEEERCSCINGKCVPDLERGECDIDFDCRNNMKCREGNCACVGNFLNGKFTEKIN